MASIFRNKTILVIIIILILVAVGYFMFGNQRYDESSGLVVATVENQANQIGNELLGILAQLKAIKIDQTIFSDEIYLSLKDIGVNISPQPVGRRNPFSPIGRESGNATSSRP